MEPEAAGEGTGIGRGLETGGVEEGLRNVATAILPGIAEEEDLRLRRRRRRRRRAVTLAESLHLHAESKQSSHAM